MLDHQFPNYQLATSTALCSLLPQSNILCSACFYIDLNEDLESIIKS